MKNYILTAILTFLLIYSGIFVAKAYSMESDVVYFDSEGRLSFNMVDNPATNTAYKTIAWTLKKYDLPIHHPDNMTITLQLKDESYLGEDGYMHTTIYVEREQILEKVSQISEEWLEEIKKIGGIAYLDNIMTVKENGEIKGYVDEDGSYYGEVYDTYDGIANARGWKNPEDLHQYFGRKIALPADEPIYKPTPPIEENVPRESTFNFMNNTISVGKYGELYSDIYDLQQAIPVLENVKAKGEFSQFAYKLIYEKVSGTKNYGVLITVLVDLEWEDSNGNKHSQSVEYSEWYEVQRNYSYYRADTFDYYYLDNWKIQNDAIGEHVIRNSFPIYAKQTAIHEIIDPEYDEHIWYYAGTYEDLPDLDLQYLAEENVGEIVTRSDHIFVGDTEILGENGVKLPSNDLRAKLSKTDMPISMDCKNVTFSTKSTCEYKLQPLGKIEISNNLIHEKNVLVNPINVHTPVVCDAAVSCNKKDNQMVTPPKDKALLVLGKEFSVYTNDTGVHIGNKGYQYNNYNKYVKSHQVRFPFEVIQKNTSLRISANTWIDIGKMCEYNTFILPVTVDEGDYEVLFRTVAVNEKNMFQEKNANLNPQNYVATDVVEVCVSGQIYGYNVIRSNDSRWTKSPLLLGYEFTSTFTTAGNINYGDYVRICPTFRFIDNQSKKATWVDLYQVISDGNENNELVMLPKQVPIEDIRVVNESDKGHVKYWEFTYCLPKQVIAVKKGINKIEIGEDDILNKQDGYLIVNFTIESVVGGVEHLSYENPINNKDGYCNMWAQEGFRLTLIGYGDYIYKYGDVMMYYAGKNFMRDFVIVGTH